MQKEQKRKAEVESTASLFGASSACRLAVGEMQVGPMVSLATPHWGSLYQHQAVLRHCLELPSLSQACLGVVKGGVVFAS